ncbi:hypothetical protein BH18CHL1_BH18CHL1_05400 [soil metagenome]
MSGAPAAAVQELDQEAVSRLLPVRQSDAHKQTHGRLVVVAGSLDYLGAGLLTTLAAVRAGAGLVCLCVPASLQGLVAGRVPEAITAGLAESAPYEVDAARALVELVGQEGDALVIGPGLAASTGTRELVSLVAQRAGWPVVLDAQALNVLAVTDRRWERCQLDAVLTPHPGEFARLDGAPVGGRDDERASRAAAAAARWGQVVVLKGARTVIASPTGQTSRAPFAEPVLATAGTGDVLAGIIGALLAQGMAPFDAACAGVWLHGMAAVDWRSRHGDAGLAASDLPPLIPAMRRHLMATRAGVSEGRRETHAPGDES